MGPEAVRILSRLGVVGALESAGAAALEGTAVTAARGASLRGAFALAGHHPFRPTGLSVSRRILDAALADGGGPSRRDGHRTRDGRRAAVR